MKIENKYIGLTLLAAFLGFWFSKYFLDITVAQLNLNGANIINLKSGFLSEYDLVFALTIGFLPLMYPITKMFGKLKSTKQSYLVLTIILISGIILWQFKISNLNRVEDIIAPAFSEHSIKRSINIESLKMGKYFAIGCFLGMILSSFIFRSINKVRTEK